MASDKKEPYKCIETNIGKLCFFHINFGESEDFYQSFDMPIDDCEPEYFIKKFIYYICYRETDLLEGKYKPEEQILSKEDIEKLTDEDIENIATIYLQNNEYLYKKRKFTHKVCEEGGTEIIDDGREDMTYPKEEGENYVQYFHRLSIIDNNNSLSNKIKKFISPTFSNKFGEDIKSTFSLGKSLSESLDFLKPQKATVIPIDTTLERIDLGEISRSIEQRKLEPIYELGDKVDNLADINIKIAAYSVKINDLQASIAKAIKKSGIISTILTIVVIFIAIVAPFAKHYWIDKKIIVTQGIEKNDRFNITVDGLNKINKGISDRNKTSTLNTESLIKQVESSSGEEKELLKELIKQQSETLNEIKLLRKKDEHARDVLKKKVVELERRLNSESK